MKLLITGAGGMLASDLQKILYGRELTALTRADLDITDLAAVRDAVAGHAIIINCAAYTKVDDAENDQERAFAVNATGAENLAKAAAEIGSTLIQVSTDYVFSGNASSAYPETAPLAPVSVYGKSKAEGERLALKFNPDKTLLVRTAWLYGADGPNFVKTILRLADLRDTLTVVDDQLGQPTWTKDVAEKIVALIEAGVPNGVFHATSSGSTTWYGFARAIFELAGLDPERVHPVSSSEFVRPAPRPSFSVLGHEAWDRVGITPIANWRDRLEIAQASGVFEATW